MDKDKQTDSAAPRPRRVLGFNRTVESGQVRQSFSHGRSKSVTVEKKRRRALPPSEPAASPQTAGQPTADAQTAAPPVADATEVKQAAAGLSAAEQAARAAAIAKARRAANDAAAAKAPTSEQRAGQKVERRPSADAKSPGAKPSGTKPPAAKPSGAKPSGAKPARPADKPAREAKSEREQTRREQKRTPDKRREQARRSGKLTIKDAFNDEERMRSLASIRRMRERERRQRRADMPQAKISRQVVVPESISVQELASRMAARSSDVMQILTAQGMSLTAEDMLDADTAQLIAEELGHSVRRVAEADVEAGVGGGEDAPQDQKPRPPVVTVMGHVDHGKTSLLDALRASAVAQSEAGGITQHIGAYQLQVKEARISFIDTPGHAAFTAMRARGANVTDIIVLVVAADDGVMPQTEEAIAHARAAKVPLVVAANKMDAAGANLEQLRSGLARAGVMLEGQGGEVPLVEISATKKQNLDKLLEAILLQAEVLELKANPHCAAEGVVLESRLDKARGALTTILVQRGTLKRGDVFVSGEQAGRVRALMDAQQKPLSVAGPGTPVEILGAAQAPLAGDRFNVVASESKAREVAAYRARRQRNTSRADGARLSMEQMLAQQNAPASERLAVIVKADAQGSAEALKQALAQLGDDKAGLDVLHAGAGEITENDILLAKTAQAVIVGFHVRASAPARKLADKENIALSYHTIIYEMLEELKTRLEGRLRPLAQETALGKADVQEVFVLSGKRKIAGCRVLEGLMRRGARARVLRAGALIGESAIDSLKHFKEDAREVKSGQECGIGLTEFDQIEKGDRIECFLLEEVARRLA